MCVCLTQDELLDSAKCPTDVESCRECKYFDSRKLFGHTCDAACTADWLIANGVTLANQVASTSKQLASSWIPVTERLPDTIPCSVGTAYSEAVNVLTTGRKVLTAIWDGTDFIADAEFWEAENEEITHWTPVLLPLPDPPEGEGTG